MSSSSLWRNLRQSCVTKLPCDSWRYQQLATCCRDAVSFSLSLSGGTRVCSDRCENARVTLYAPSSSITNNGYHILVGNTYIIITATKVRGGRYAPRVYTPTKLPHHRHTHVMPRKMKSLTPRQTIRFFIHRWLGNLKVLLSFISRFVAVITNNFFVDQLRYVYSKVLF